MTPELHVAIRSLHSVSLSECPVSRLDCAGAEVAQLQQLNLSNTAVADWAEVDRLRGLPGLTHLRMMDCPFNRSGESDCTIKRNLFAKTTFAKTWCQNKLDDSNSENCTATP